MDNNKKFVTTEIAQKIEECKKELYSIYEKNSLKEEIEKIERKFQEISEVDKIRVVFIGQYTAGKSTIISALTHDKSIKIDSDIATSKTSDYSWNGVILTDTPGLYTENPEHDAITIDMIKKADLLVYCITSDLFNQYTKQDFIKWAFEKGYAGKMFLVINKMSKEAGEYEELVKNYTSSINQSLTPHSLEEFEYCFIDAKDYKDGTENNDQYLMKDSYFETFIDKLNRFVENKGLLGRLDKPIMILKSSIEDNYGYFTDDEGDVVFNRLLTRIERRIDRQRSQLSSNANITIKRGLREIIEYGDEIAEKIGSEEITQTEEEINEFINNKVNEISDSIEVLNNEAIEQLNKEVEEILDSDLAEFFMGSIDGAYEGKAHLFETKEKKFNRDKFEAVKTVTQGILGKVVAGAVKPGGKAGLIIAPGAVAGGGLHQAVKKVGHMVGFKFKPWGAVKIARGIGIGAVVAGGAIAAIDVVLTLKQNHDEDKRAKEILKAQIDVRNDFKATVDNLEGQFMKYMDEVYDTFTNVNDLINQKREENLSMKKVKNDSTDKLIILQRKLGAIQKEIF